MKRKVVMKDGRKEVWQGNRLIAYVDPETDVLCVLDRKGYVKHRGPIITHEREILDALPPPR